MQNGNKQLAVSCLENIVGPPEYFNQASCYAVEALLLNSPSSGSSQFLTTCFS
jgi:hypothetical protein